MAPDNLPVGSMMSTFQQENNKSRPQSSKGKKKKTHNKGPKDTISEIQNFQPLNDTQRSKRTSQKVEVLDQVEDFDEDQGSIPNMDMLNA